jgi:prevent-host-death family protein
MITVGIRELRQQASALIRKVREDGSQVEITLRGKPVALLIPVEHTPAIGGTSLDWDNLDHLAAEIGARWPDGVSAAAAVAEGRE